MFLRYFFLFIRTWISSRTLFLASLIIRIAIGGLFIYSSIPKIIDPIGFAMSIENYMILPIFLIKPAAFFLSYFMLLIGLALISGFHIRLTIIAAQFLLIIFIVALLSAIIRGIDIECGCFKGAKLKAKVALILDLILLCLSFLVTFYSSERNK